MERYRRTGQCRRRESVQLERHLRIRRENISNRSLEWATLYVPLSVLTRQHTTR
jgi:hypothetical protein